jgi:hypothetical protein
MSNRAPAPKRIPPTDPPSPLPPTPPTLAQRVRIESGRYAIVAGAVPEWALRESVAPAADHRRED